uniref:Phospholipase A2 domain-containing protein n=1 Tax=Vombatus ursinus TaxID=29139 RepID=A0A4X2LP09_VOMUR
SSDKMEPVPLLLLLCPIFTSSSLRIKGYTEVGHKQRHFHYILGKSHVHRRRFLELAGAGSCTTSPSALAYMIYGCSCGIGGTDWPPDKTDCKVEEAGCSPKMECYNWECRDQRVECVALISLRFGVL